MSLKRVLGASIVAGLAMTASAHAAPITFDFTSITGSFSGSGYANSYSLTSGGVTVTVTGWSFTGSSFAPAQVVLAPPGQGLGVCNTTEGLNCGDAGVGNADNVSQAGSDLLLFQLSGPAQLVGAVLDPFNVGGSPDRDASYWIGSPSLPGDLLNGETVATINTLFGVLSPVTVDNSTGSDSLTFPFAGSPAGNALVIGAAIGQTNDNFRVRSLSIDATAVPEPATLGLLGAGLLAGVGFSVRRGRTASSAPRAAAA